MRVLFTLGLALALFAPVATADDLKSGPDKTHGGAFYVKAVTGDKVDRKKLCYVCEYGAEKRPAVVAIFTQKADDDLAKLVKEVDAVQKSHDKLGTFVVGISGVAAADFKKLQDTHKLTTPLTVAEDKDGPEAYHLNKDAVVTVVVYKGDKSIVKNFAFKSTKEAAEKAKEIAATAEKALN